MVICSEKKVKCGFEIKIYFHTYFKFKWFRKFLNYIELGFVNISWHVQKYTTADKIVERWNKHGEQDQGIRR